MKKDETKTKNTFGSSENIKPYIVVGVGVLVVAVTVYQLIAGAPGNILESRLDPKASKEAANPGSTQTNEQDLVVANIDSDADGLTDTEEERIYHTDPLKPDTDGDTYKDGDEVRTGHDPLVNESGTKSSTSSTTDTSGQQYNRFIASSPDDLSNLDPSKYLSDQDLKNLQSGDPSQESIDKLSTLALANTTMSQTSVLPSIPDSAIKITSASGKQAVQQYVIAAGSILMQVAPFSDENSMVTYFNSSLTGDVAKTQQLVQAAKTAEAQLKQVTVPKEIVDLHKQMIGLLEIFQQSAGTLMNADSVDPQTGLVAVNQLRVIVNAATALQSSMSAIIQKYNINVTL